MNNSTLAKIFPEYIQVRLPNGKFFCSVDCFQGVNHPNWVKDDCILKSFLTAKLVWFVKCIINAVKKRTTSNINDRKWIKDDCILKSFLTAKYSMVC